MARRYGWLHDYEYSLNQGKGVLPEQPQPGSQAQPNQAPVNINININLGDLLSQIASGKKSAKEALEEAVKSKPSKRTKLNG